MAGSWESQVAALRPADPEPIIRTSTLTGVGMGVAMLVVMVMGMVGSEGVGGCC